MLPGKSLLLPPSPSTYMFTICTYFEITCFHNLSLITCVCLVSACARAQRMLDSSCNFISVVATLSSELQRAVRTMMARTKKHLYMCLYDTISNSEILGARPQVPHQHSSSFFEDLEIYFTSQI